MGRNLVSRIDGLRFDLVAAVGGLVVAVLLFPLRFFASQIYIKTIPIVLGVACVLYLLASYNDRQAAALPTLPAPVARSLPCIVITGLAALVLVAVVHGERSPLFLDLASVLGALVVGQILFTDDRDFDRTLLLTEVVLLAFVVRFSGLYTTPGLIGIDSWTHVTQLAAGIRAEGSLSAIADDKHFASPFYHLVVASAAIVYDVSLRNALYLSVGVLMPLSVLLVYSTANLLVTDRWAVLATMLYSVGNYVVEWGIHVIPTSLGLVFFLAVLYALVRLMWVDNETRDFALLILLTLAVILTHQVSTFIMLILLGAAFLSQIVIQISPFETTVLDPDVFRTRKPVNLVGIVVFDVGFTVFVWSLTPYKRESFLATVLTWLRETLASSAGLLNLAGGSASGGGGGESAGPTTIELVAQYVDVLGFLLLLCAALVGCLYVIHRERANQSVLMLLFAAAVMLVFVLGLPMFGIRNFIPQRWFAFLYAPLAILAVIGIRHLATNLQPKLFLACLLVFLLAFPGAMLLSSQATIDSPVFEDQYEQLSYSESELTAADTIGEMTGSPRPDEIRPDQVVYTDHPYQTMFKRTHAHPADTATVVDGEPVTHDVVVYRERQSTEATYFIDEDGYGQVRDVPRSRICRPGQGTVYANGDVTMCVSPR
jgi:hypothetical protein